MFWLRVLTCVPITLLAQWIDDLTSVQRSQALNVWDYKIRQKIIYGLTLLQPDPGRDAGPADQIALVQVQREPGGRPPGDHAGRRYRHHHLPGLHTAKHYNC